MSSLTITNLKKSFGALDILHGINLDIRQGEFIVFVGPSGCGKSTLLRTIAGLEEITSGTIAIDGEVVNDLTPAERQIAMVFQSYALYPHMTVFDNMAFGLKMAKVGRPEIERRVREAAEMLQLTPLLERLPKQLSGGQRQRVAIGRAITRDPKLFLFDEPLSNLDAALRVATRIEIASLKARMPDATMIYVTHDQVEAMTLADRIVVLNTGRIEQVGTPLELYHTPANKFVAGFIGSPAMNFVSVLNGAEGLQTASGEVVLPANGTATTLGIRPEDLSLHNGGPVLLRGRVSFIESLGELVMAYVDVGEGEPIIVKLPGSSTIATGEAIALQAEAGRIKLFEADGTSIGTGQS
ncbi:MAG: sn-glycerol-3-phosphate ABC transporter ATP-binding protein UgpC [Rhizobium sp.]|nr:sn-glycerol-3-phosphate ABC transporter ATP-binding protein UgpC [Rhizobium sp.]